MISALRFVFKFLLPPGLVLAGLLRFLAEGEFGLLAPALFPYLDVAFKILLSATVGYFTNYLAITMLFKPKEKTRHGIQGLIPRNQDRIAERMGTGIAENFFNPKDLKAYLKENAVIDESIAALTRYAEKNLEDPKTQRLITNWILRKFQINSPRIYYGLMQVSEINLVNYLRQEVDLKHLLHELSLLIETNIKNGTIDLKTLADRISSHLEAHTPEISRFLYEQLNKLIERQGVIKKNMMKLAVWTFDLDQQTIANFVYDALSSDKFRTNAYQFLEKAVQDFAEFLNSEQGTKKVNLTYQRLVIALNERIREKGVNRVLHEINKYLEKESSWKKIESLLKRVLSFSQQALDEFVVSDRFDRFLTRSMPAVLEKIKVSQIVTNKVKTFDTGELEKMVKDASGEHLAAIEVLGGILGGFAGIALVDPLWFVIILCPLVAIGFIEWFLTRRQLKKSLNDTGDQQASP